MLYTFAIFTAEVTVHQTASTLFIRTGMLSEAVDACVLGDRGSSDVGDIFRLRDPAAACGIPALVAGPYRRQYGGLWDPAPACRLPILLAGLHHDLRDLTAAYRIPLLLAGLYRKRQWNPASPTRQAAVMSRN